MPRLDAGTQAHARGLVESMRSFDPAGTSVLSWVAPEIASLVRSDHVGVFTMCERNDRTAIGRFDAVGFALDGPRRLGEQLARIAGQPSESWSFDPIRPDARQRNRIFDSTTLERITGVSRRSYPIFDFLERVGLGRAEQLRVLVCDGAALLAYVGAFQPEPCTAHQRDRPRRRGTCPRFSSDAGLRATPRKRHAAGLGARGGARGHRPPRLRRLGAGHDPTGSARARARLLLRANADVRRALADAVARRPARYAFDLTPLRIVGGPAYHLAVLRDGTRESFDAVHTAAVARWGLTAPAPPGARDGRARHDQREHRRRDGHLPARRRAALVSAIFDRVGVEESSGPRSAASCKAGESLVRCPREGAAMELAVRSGWLRVGGLLVACTAQACGGTTGAAAQDSGADVAAASDSGSMLEAGSEASTESGAAGWRSGSTRTTTASIT